jgi:putative acetyltransferase
MTAIPVTIERAPAATTEVSEILAELDEALSGPYSADQRHALSVDRLFRDDVHFYLARLDGRAVGCGGVAMFEDFAELKRMYTRREARRRGVAAALIARLEDDARAAGLGILRLETGMFQHESLAFYERVGFRRRDAFGVYLALPPHAIETSVFFEKRI